MHPRVNLVAGPLRADAPVVAVAVRPGEPGPAVTDGADVVAALGVDAAAVLTARKTKGEPGEVVEAPVARDGVDVLLLVGVGDGEPAALRKAAAAVVRRASGATAVVTNIADGASADGVAAAAEAAVLAGFTFSRRSTPSDKPILEVRLVGSGDVTGAVTIAEATCLARELAATPSLEKTPQWMVDRIRALAADAQLDVTVWDEARLQAEGFGGISAVGRGSARPPRLVRLDYAPPGAAGDRIVLVGKGITFDSGGLNLKTGSSMSTMKSDMGGAAACVAAVAAIARLRIPVEVIATVPMAENMPSGSAYRPSDVVTLRGGRKIEIANTDAEGRVILADGIVRAAEDDPNALIEVSTLTGGQLVALGTRVIGAMGEPGLRDLVVSAGNSAGEALWAMPLPDELRAGLDSPVADLSTLTGDAFASMLVGGVFLGEFVPGDLPWVHLDIAGPSFNSRDPYGYTPKGGTGAAVRTIIASVNALAGQAS